HPGGQRNDRERQQPAEGLGVDQKRMADPIEAGEEIAEAEPPADRGGREHSAEAAGRAVDEPDQDRKRNEGQRPNVGGRPRQRRGRAGKERDQNTPPSLGQYDGMGEAGERHGRWAGFDGAASGESLSASSPVTGGGGAGALGGAGAGPTCRRMTGRLPLCR